MAEITRLIVNENHSPFSKPFLPTHLVQQVVIVTVLDGIQRRIGIATILKELPDLPGYVRVWLPVALTVDGSVKTGLMPFFGRHHIVPSAIVLRSCLGPFLLHAIDGHNDDDTKDANPRHNPSPIVAVLIPGLSSYVIIDFGHSLCVLGEHRIALGSLKGFSLY